MIFVQTDMRTSEEVAYVTCRKDDKIYIINRNARYLLGILYICGNKLKVEGEEHLFSCEKDALECLLEKVLQYE